MGKAEIEERIRLAAKNTDLLITKLDTLTGRIDTAKSNQNQELAEHYERQFAETSVEFMDGVECILDDWYSLNGETRPAVDLERLSPEVLDEIHSAVVGIVQGLQFSSETGPSLRAALAETALEDVPQRKAAPKQKVDLTG